MAKVNCSSEMVKFHREKVTLRKLDQDEMRNRRDAGRSRLEAGLERDGYALPAETATQGSYAMRTMVQDSDSDYDIDDGAYFKKEDLVDSDGNNLLPTAARQRICDALTQDDRLKYPAKVHNNCVRQKYPEGYHIDIPVYRTFTSIDHDGQTRNNYELASLDEWIPSDARAVTRWFEQIVGNLNAGEDDGSQLRRVVRLTKSFARSRKPWKEAIASGICLTKLVVECFSPVTDRDDASLHETLKKISNRLTISHKIDHPINGTLARHGDPKVAFFEKCLNDALSELKVLDEEGCKKKKALSAWDKVFNTTFFVDQYIAEETPPAKVAVGSLLSQPAQGSDFTFPDRPVVPNKPAGFA